MKKLFSLFLCLTLLFSIAGCDKLDNKKKEKNNLLTCTYDAILYSLAYSTGDIESIKIGNTVHEYYFDNETKFLKKVAVYEKFNKDVSEDYYEDAKKESSSEYTFSMQDGHLILDYGIMYASEFEDEYQNKTIEEIKKTVEEESYDGIDVVCKISSVEDEETDHESTINNSEVSEESTLVCNGNDGRTNNMYTFYFNNGDFYKYVIKIEIPSQYDANTFYIEEEKMNAGRFEMSLEGNYVIQKLDSSMAYWNSFSYKDENRNSLSNIFEGYGYKCE